jgi:LCP family protein required for cell wall assembly
LSSDTEQTTPSRAPVAEPRSGAVAAVLSAIFPGAGQLYLGERRTALIFAAPVIALLAFVVFVFLNRSLAVRILDPSVSFALMIVALMYGIWWIVAVVHAWRGGWHQGLASAVLVVALILVVGSTDVFGAYQLWRIRNAGEDIFGGINPLNETPPPATPSPTPLPPGATIDPSATPTPRPPDYVDPSSEPSDEPEPSIDPGPTPEYNITEIDANSDGYLNVLLVGLDWMPGRTSKRTDTILVLSANHETGEVLMFSFPRDSARIPLYNGGTFHGKINTFAGFANRNPEVFPEGGLKSLAYEAGYLLGIPIDYYASINMPGFQEVVRLVGGVDVVNTRNITDDTLQFYLPPGEYRLGPDDALRYVRSRHGSGGDFGRNERQQQVLSALRKELLKPENLAKLPDIVEALSLVINTDFPPDQIDTLVALADQVEEEPSQSFIFRYPEWASHQRRIFTCGRSVIQLRMDKIAALSIELFGENSLWNGKTPPPMAVQNCPPGAPTPPPQ